VPSESASFSDQIVFNDTSAVPLVLAGASTQSAAHTASRTGTATVSGTRSESAVYTTAISGQTSLAGTRTEAYSHTSTRVCALTFVPMVGIAYPRLLLLGKTYPGQTYVLQAAVSADSRSGSIAFAGSSSDQYNTGGAQTYNDQAVGTIVFSARAGFSYPGTILLGYSYPGQVWLRQGSVHTKSGTASFTLFGGGSEISNVRFGRVHPRRDHGFDENTKPARTGFGKPRPRRVRVG
jgi:hypothetical protein